MGSIVNALQFIGPDEKKLREVFSLVAAANCGGYAIEDDGILMFYSDRILSEKRMLKISTVYPNNLFFWSWYSEITDANGYFRMQNGEVLKKRVNVPKR
jgi:hypothetical protein